ncbi:hypothetical protein GF339_23860 [candidate division KSB3 bacterium]|uniref:Sulfotransferase family protein n=1 Tax=candidate division KSB3 bacterium TaxID=2044937 RepID=A0A9D5K0P2_9BACT|nr:hypothetical protein [candidate division KSB3 bacterium]MBD3327640.1 hypothetical protein [candidate division KSB3 bacterium]
MRDVTLITGPLRSGTSCVTGLLECCGFDLGKNIRILREPSEYNPNGHFEPDLLYTINERLLIESANGPWSILRIPGKAALAELAAQREKYFRLFLRKFDGEVCKDPLMCLTLRFWDPYWPELQRVVFCLRHPLAVAHSIRERYWLPVAQGVEVWRTYVTRFFEGATRCQVFIFDFDAFCQAPRPAFNALLTWLGRSIPEKEMQYCLDTFLTLEYIHWWPDDVECFDIPVHIRDLYREIQSRAGAWR